MKVIFRFLWEGLDFDFDKPNTLVVILLLFIILAGAMYGLSFTFPPGAPGSL